MIELILHMVSFGGLFLKDPYSILDLIVIGGNLIFILLHFYLKPEDEGIAEHPMQKIYGILRLLHACLIFRKLDELTRDYKAIHRVHDKLQK